MGILDRREQADALCTVIALGFIIESKGKLKRHSYIIDTENENEYSRHLELQKKLKKLTNSEAQFEIEKQSANEKFEHPVILAQTDYSVLQNDIIEDKKVIFGQLESAVNEFANIPLRGAYVGGALVGDIAELLDPSILYWYKSKYRGLLSKEALADPEKAKQRKDIKTSYDSALRVTKGVQSFFEALRTKYLRRNGTMVRLADFHPISKVLEEQPKGSDLFASVHGMTQSIIHYSRSKTAADVNIELALSKNTCKVASCIPCSIFMHANNTPATATHFGRGDNWNFTPDILMQIQGCSKAEDVETLPIFARNWMEYIWTAYDMGKKYFPTGEGSWISSDLRDVLKLDSMMVPQLFLEALTFEGSFVDKMLSTLKNMP